MEWNKKQKCFKKKLKLYLTFLKRFIIIIKVSFFFFLFFNRRLILYMSFRGSF